MLKQYNRTYKAAVLNRKAVTEALIVEQHKTERHGNGINTAHKDIFHGRRSKPDFSLSIIHFSLKSTIFAPK